MIHPQPHEEIARVEQYFKVICKNVCMNAYKCLNTIINHNPHKKKKCISTV